MFYLLVVLLGNGKKMENSKVGRRIELLYYEVKGVSNSIPCPPFSSSVGVFTVYVPVRDNQPVGMHLKPPYTTSLSFQTTCYSCRGSLSWQQSDPAAVVWPGPMGCPTGRQECIRLPFMLQRRLWGKLWLT